MYYLVISYIDLTVSMATLILNRKYDVGSCLSQSEDINSLDIFVKMEFMTEYEKVCHEDKWCVSYLILLRLSSGGCLTSYC